MQRYCAYTYKGLTPLEFDRASKNLKLTNAYLFIRTRWLRQRENGLIIRGDRDQKKVRDYQVFLSLTGRRRKTSLLPAAREYRPSGPNLYRGCQMFIIYDMLIDIPPYRGRYYSRAGDYNDCHKSTWYITYSLSRTRLMC